MILGGIMIVGYLGCSFDLMNVTDLDLIRQAGLVSEWLVVGVFSDEYIAALTGQAPVVPLEERLALVAAVRGVDAVQVHDETGTPMDTHRFRVSRLHGSDGQGTALELVPATRTASLALSAMMASSQQEVA